MHIIQNDAKAKLDEAQRIRSQYEKITIEAETIKKRLSDKEENLDVYIQSEASTQISAKWMSLKKKKSNAINYWISKSIKMILN